MMRWMLVLVLVVVGCRRPDPGPAPAASASAQTSTSTSASVVPPVSASAHVAILEEVADVHRKKLPCQELEGALAPLRQKMKALGDVADPRLGVAIESDPELRTRRQKALEAIMDGAMRCRPDAG